MTRPRASIRAMAERDVDAVMQIQAACPEIAQWTQRGYLQAVQGEMAGWVAEESGSMAGFLVTRKVLDEMEILNLAVAPEVRRRGVATLLLDAALTLGRRLGAAKAYLEVRASNLTALHFYERRGFSATGRRRGYYIEPAEDAIVMSADLGISAR